MFDQLSKLLGRDFLLAHFFPATVFALVHYFFFDPCGLFEAWGLGSLPEEASWLAATGATVAIGLLALLLMFLNRPLIRLKEGYGPLERFLNPLLAYQRRRWRRLHEKLRRIDDRLEAAGEGASGRLLVRRIHLHSRAARDFPHEETWLLPTAFGNTIRAFEAYPFVMYGFEATTGWPRLLAVVPKDFREQINGARTLVDFWVNAWALGWIFALECLFLGALCGGEPQLSLAAVAALLAWGSSRRARGAAIQWGELVKSAFDIFLPALAEKLWKKDVEDGKSPEWWSFSQAITYRNPKALRLEQEDAQPAPPSGSGLVEGLSTWIELVMKLVFSILRRRGRPGVKTGRNLPQPDRRGQG